jgi:hypothetical protein
MTTETVERPWPGELPPLVYEHGLSAKHAFGRLRAKTGELSYEALVLRRHGVEIPCFGHQRVGISEAPDLGTEGHQLDRAVVVLGHSDLALAGGTRRSGR